MHPPEEPELTINAVVLKVRGHSRELSSPSWTISPATLESLRAGVNDNPSLIHVLALATAFSAPPAYFFDDELAARMDDQLETYQTMRALGVDSVILRASQHDLKPSVRDRILNALTAAFRPDPAARGDQPRSTEPRHFLGISVIAAINDCRTDLTIQRRVGDRKCPVRRPDRVSEPDVAQQAWRGCSGRWPRSPIRSSRSSRSRSRRATSAPANTTGS